MTYEYLSGHYYSKDFTGKLTLLTDTTEINLAKTSLELNAYKQRELDAKLNAEIAAKLTQIGTKQPEQTINNARSSLASIVPAGIALMNENIKPLN